MIIFARKHFSSKNARIYSFLINLAIYFRAGVALLNRAIKRLTIPLIDYGLIVLGLFLIASQYQRIEDIIIPQNLLNYGLPIYGLVWFITQIFSGGYDKPVKLIKNGVGAVIGTGVILMIYALLSKEYQFSRLIILLGGGWVLIYYLISRLLLHFALGESYRIGGSRNKRFVIVGELKEAERVGQLLRQTNSKVLSTVFLSATNTKDNEAYVGTINQLDQVIDIQKIDEVIFCAKDVSAATIISKMLQLEGSKLDFKIAQPETSFLIGSNSIDSQGDLYVMDINKINKPANRRNKRLIDFILSFLALMLSPVICWFYKNKTKFFGNMFSILTGKLSFVGYARIEHSSNLKLPKIKRGVLTSVLMVNESNLDADAISRLNLIYAKNHSYLMDLKIVFNNLSKLSI